MVLHTDGARLLAKFRHRMLRHFGGDSAHMLKSTLSYYIDMLPYPYISSQLLIRYLNFYYAVDKNYYYYIRLTTCVSHQQKHKQFWILMKQEVMGWQWHQLDHTQIICTSLQTTTDNHISTIPLSFFQALPFLSPNQQRQSTEGSCSSHGVII